MFDSKLNISIDLNPDLEFWLKPDSDADPSRRTLVIENFVKSKFQLQN
jgi:hypothetical protein